MTESLRPRDVPFEIDGPSILASPPLIETDPGDWSGAGVLRRVEASGRDARRLRAVFGRSGHAATAAATVA